MTIRARIEQFLLARSLMNKSEGKDEVFRQQGRERRAMESA